VLIQGTVGNKQGGLDPKKGISIATIVMNSYSRSAYSQKLRSVRNGKKRKILKPEKGGEKKRGRKQMTRLVAFRTVSEHAREEKAGPT